MRSLSGLLAVLSAASALAATPGFPSYSQFAGKPYDVSYNNRSLLLNGAPALFSAGVIHPPRFSGPAEWEQAFESAKQLGLNAIQLYVFANFHQPTENAWIWDGPANVTRFIEMAGEADLFVNLRIGPYVCAEWDYGGIPEWLGRKDGVQFRTSNDVWQTWMEEFYGRILNGTQSLFASHGGPVVLVQVENELHGAPDSYVSWCGDMAHKQLSQRGISVPVGMCNGQSAQNTINTCNGNSCTSFIEENGQAGDILKDKPALWTENEGGFQIWGESPKKPTSYFWGRTPAEQAFATAQWYARGGSYMSFYMLHGGAHFDRWAGAGLTHYYSVDSPVCPDGLPHEPKYSHFAAMFDALRTVAPAVAYAPAQLRKQQPLQWYDPTKHAWETGTQQYAFVYSSTEGEKAGLGQVAFVESVADVEVLTRWNGINITMPPSSVAIVEAGNSRVLWVSGNVPAPTASRRSTVLADGFQWQSWAEPFGSDMAKLNLPVVASQSPSEAGDVLQGQDQFLYYSTNVSAAAFASADEAASSTTTLTFEASLASAFVVLVDGKAAAFVDDHGHRDGTHTYTADLPASLITAALSSSPDRDTNVTITILFASLGYSNDMGSGSTRKLKGILGSVKLGSNDITSNGWTQRPRLAGAVLGVPQGSASGVQWQDGASSAPLTWMKASFDVPQGTLQPGAAVSLNATGLGRGHFFVNGHDAGRYWNIDRNDGAGRTQTLFHVPADWLSNSNELVVVDTLGAPDATQASIVVSTFDGPAPSEPSGGWANEIHSCQM